MSPCCTCTCRTRRIRTSIRLDEHPWRALPIALGMIVLLAVVLIVVSFALSKAIAGQAY